VSENLDFTGERFTPECVREIRYEHFHRYALAADWLDGLKVLDAACGEGYGSQLLAAKARKVTGIDISAAAVAHATSRYNLSNLEFLVADCCATPFEDNSFDCIVSFETLEHLENQEQLLAEFRRLLRPGGFLIISSPDKAIYSDRMGYENPYHVRELYKDEFENLLANEFPAVQMLGQKLGFHSVVWPLEGERTGRYKSQRESVHKVQTMQKPSDEPVYLLAICAESPDHWPAFDQDLFLFDDDSGSVYQHYIHEIRHNMTAGAVMQGMEAELKRLREALECAQSQSPAESAAAAGSWLSRLKQKFLHRPD